MARRTGSKTRAKKTASKAKTKTKSKPTKSKSKPAKSKPAKSKPAKSKPAKSKSKPDLSTLDGYLRDWREYPITQVRHARCKCGADRFEVELDDENGAAKRTCVGCEREHLICDSAEYWDEAEPDDCACPCGNETFRLAAGFAFYEDPKGTPTRDVRWIYIGLQCAKCDQIGVYGGWKISYGPSHQLLDQV